MTENSALIMHLLRVERTRLERELGGERSAAVFSLVTTRTRLSLSAVNAEIARRIPQQGLRGPLSEWGQGVPAMWYYPYRARNIG